MAQFHLAELRERGVDAEPLHVGGVHAGDQRLDQPLEDLAAESAAHERGHALVGVVAARRQEVFQRRPEFAPAG